MHVQPFGVTICDRTIRVHGDVDMAVTPQLIDAITCVAENHEHHTVVVDMAWVTFLDSSGIAALLSAHKLVEGMDKKLVIYNVPEKIHRLLTLTAVVDSLNVRSVV